MGRRRRPLPDNFKSNDDVDRIVDAVLADPSRAEAAKVMLRRKILGGETVHLVPPSVSDHEQADDLWDNVPV